MLTGAVAPERGGRRAGREITTTGDHAAEVLREHLIARDFSPAPSANPNLWTLTETSARVEWYVN